MGPGASAGQKTVLIVDDSEDLQELVRELLQLEGFRVLACRTADDLLAAIEADRPDVLIIDVFAPGRPAWDAYDVVKADPNAASIPVIVCTAAHSEVQRRQTLLDAHGSRVVPKPFDIDELVAQVRQATA